MNTPNPLVPQGTFATKAKSPVPLTVFAILAVHVVLLGLLLIAGCNRKPSVDTAQDTTTVPPVPPPQTTPVDNWPTSSPPAVPTTPVTTDVTPVPAPTDPIVPPPHPVASTPVVAPPPAGGAVADGLTEHTISKGESFYTLGKKYNVGYKAIVDSNPGVNPNRLKPGDKVKIPPPRPSGAMTVNATAAPSADGARTYKVKSGDNLIKIAATFGVPVKQLRSANNLATDQIKVGQVLKIPAKQPAPGVVPPSPAVPPVSPPTPQ